jgi:hypothetical protein
MNGNCNPSRFHMPPGTFSDYLPAAEPYEP